MAQVLQDMNQMTPEDDPEKLGRLDKEFKLHEDLLALEKESEMLQNQNKKVSRF